MSESGSLAARLVAEKLPDDISIMVIDLAQERLRAMQTASASLDQRCTQAAAFQLAAAAIAGSFLASGTVTHVTLWASSLACLAFVIGALLAFIGVWSGHQHLPGVEASYWERAMDFKDFTVVDARSWLAALYEDSIRHNRGIDEKRARGLNLSVGSGVLGGVFICAAAFSRLLG